MKSCADEEALGRIIYQTSLLLQNFADKLLKPYGLTLEQFHPLKVLALQDEHLTQRQIGEEVKKTPANMTRLLDRLAAKNLIERRENPDDRRAFLVVLTPEGKTVVEQVITLFDSFSEQLYSGVSEQEHDTSRATLKKMATNIAKMETDLAM